MRRKEAAVAGPRDLVIRDQLHQCLPVDIDQEKWFARSNSQRRLDVMLTWCGRILLGQSRHGDPACSVMKGIFQVMLASVQSHNTVHG